MQVATRGQAIARKANITKVSLLIVWF